jgi:hypothetical protein
MGGIGCWGPEGGRCLRRMTNEATMIHAIPPKIHQIEIFHSGDGSGGTYGEGIIVGDADASGVADTVAGGKGIVSIAPFSNSAIGVAVGVGVSLMVMIFLQMVGVSENTLLLSRTRQEAPCAPIVV